MTKDMGNKLGDYSFQLVRFKDLEAALDALITPTFLEEENKKLEKINLLLLRLIQDHKTPCFLLAAVSEFIQSVLDRKWVDSYSLSQFEFWLNNFSGLTEEENYLVRAKIMGKYIPREAYQTLFPIGMGKKHFGSHYVTAHNSPDLDTTIASFWGWVDAFAARVGEGLHIWNVPGGPPDSQVEIKFLFYNVLGSTCFDHFAKTRTSLAISALDLVTQKGVVKKTLADSVEKIDYEKNCDAVIVEDEEGAYLGDWRYFDLDGVRKVTILLNNCLRWFASHLQAKLTSLFSFDVLQKKDAILFIEEVFALRFFEAEPAGEFTEKNKRKVADYLVKVLGVKNGLKATFGEFWSSMGDLSLTPFVDFRRKLEELPSSALFDGSGLLIENRSPIFLYLEQVVLLLEEAIQSLRRYIDRLEIAFLIKKEVLGYSYQAISHRAEVEEIRGKMGTYSYLTVTSAEIDEKQSPIGIVKAVDLSRPILGTVTLRDFCNRDETKIPPYFEVISVVDHHKSVLSTSSAPVAFIADAQSANALVAELAFSMNDRYSTFGCSLEQIQQEFKEYAASSSRILQRLLQKQMVFERKQDYFIDRDREYLEYLQYLYAILDDTDLLSKVSSRDVLCVASLLNRLKSLTLGREVELISFDDIAQDERFAGKAAKRILQNEEMYSLYKKIYSFKEVAVEEALRLCAAKEPSNVFADTKIQNGCNRVGQTKLFVKNFPSFLSYSEQIRSLWCLEARRFYEERPECDLHMHMISTVPSAEDVYKGSEEGYSHQDQLWVWIPNEEQSIGHLKSFLSMFSALPQLASQVMEIEFLGENSKVLEQIFHESFRLHFQKKMPQDKKISDSVAILRYKAGLLNSRKAMISPCLPKLTS